MEIQGLKEGVLFLILTKERYGLALSKTAEKWKGGRQRTGEQRAGGKTGCEEEERQMRAWVRMEEAACRPELKTSRPQWRHPPGAPAPSTGALLTHEHHSSLSVFGDLLQQLQAFPPVTISPRHVQGLLRTQNWNRAGTQTGGRGRPLPSLALALDSVLQPLDAGPAFSHPSQGRGCW